MSYYVCPYCNRAHTDPDASCCGERGHCQPLDEYLAESPADTLYRVIRDELPDGWDSVRSRLDGRDMAGDEALLCLAYRIAHGETDIGVLRCISNDVLDAITAAKETA